MLEDDSGQEIQCPYCSEVDPCEHLLAMIDQTFFECPAGYASDRFYAFESTIMEVFLRWRDGGTTALRPRFEGALQELWKSAPKEWDPEERGVLDHYVYFSLVTQLLEDAGGERYGGPVHDGYAPGFSSAMTLIYAERPWAVFAKALLDLKKRLGQSSE